MSCAHCLSFATVARFFCISSIDRTDQRLGRPLHELSIRHPLVPVQHHFRINGHSHSLSLAQQCLLDEHVCSVLLSSQKEPMSQNNYAEDSLIGSWAICRGVRASTRESIRTMSGQTGKHIGTKQPGPSSRLDLTSEYK